jgi:hypothetical protein
LLILLKADAGHFFMLIFFSNKTKSVVICHLENYRLNCTSIYFLITYVVTMKSWTEFEKLLKNTFKLNVWTEMLSKIKTLLFNMSVDLTIESLLANTRHIITMVLKVLLIYNVNGLLKVIHVIKQQCCVQEHTILTLKTQFFPFFHIF